MRTKPSLGLDIGGSSVKWALVSDTDIVARGIVPIDQRRTPETVIAVLDELVGDLRRGYGDTAAIGVGIPGILDEDTGVPTLLPNFPDSWHGYPFAAAVEARVGQSVTLVNDAKAFSVAESVLGAAAGRALVACVTIGTGIGGGVVHNGVLFRGAGTAGEFGHLTVELDGPRCGCGNRGCVEALAGAAAITERAGRGTVEEVFDAARAGDVRAAGAVTRAVAAIAAGLASVYVTLAPDVFVIGGGVAGAGERFIADLRAETRRRVTVAPAERVAVVGATLGRHGGAVGAALMSVTAARSPRADPRA